MKNKTEFYRYINLYDKESGRTLIAIQDTDKGVNHKWTLEETERYIKYGKYPDEPLNNEKNETK